MNKIILIVGLALFGCKEQKSKFAIEEPHLVIKVWKESPKSIHDEMSPKFRAVLENGDTIPVIPYTSVGDTIIYRFIHTEYNK